MWKESTDAGEFEIMMGGEQAKEAMTKMKKKEYSEINQGLVQMTNEEKMRLVWEIITAGEDRYHILNENTNTHFASKFSFVSIF